MIAEPQPRHRIREWRKHRGLTQEQLAERIGIARSYLTKIERGSRRYDQPFLEAAAEALRCGPADLINIDPTAPDGLWSVWEQLTAPERAQAVAVIRALHGAGTGTHG
jgi:transcriptional regulator with XRE-family HTH domain